VDEPAAAMTLMVLPRCDVFQQRIPGQNISAICENTLEMPDSVNDRLRSDPAHVLHNASPVNAMHLTSPIDAFVEKWRARIISGYAGETERQPLSRIKFLL